MFESSDDLALFALFDLAGTLHRDPKFGADFAVGVATDTGEAVSETQYALLAFTQSRERVFHEQLAVDRRVEVRRFNEQ